MQVKSETANLETFEKKKIYIYIFVYYRTVTQKIIYFVGHSVSWYPMHSSATKFTDFHQRFRGLSQSTNFKLKKGN